MSLYTATITYDISDMVGVDFDARRTKIWVTTNVPGDAIIDTDGAQIRLGDGLGSLDEDGTGSVQVWVPGDGSNPASWQTYIHVDHSDRRPAGVGGKREVRTFGPFTITEDTDLAYLVDEQEVPPTYLSQVTAELQTYVDAASTFADDSQASADASEQARLAAEALILSDLGTTDGQTRALIENPDSQTSTALLASVAKSVSGDPDYSDSVADAVYTIASTVATAVVAPQVATLVNVSRAAFVAGKRLRARTAADLRRQVQVVLGTLTPSSSASGLETSLGSSTLTNSSKTITTPGAHGLVVGDPIRLASKTGGSFLNGSNYYVSAVPTTTTFRIYAANATSGSDADFGSDGTATVYKFPPVTEQFYSRSLYALALTVTAASDLFTSASPHTLVVGDAITLASTTATGTANDVRYYVKTTPTTTTFRVSSTLGGSTLDVTADGTATLLRVNPKVVVTDGRPIQSTTGSPQNDMIKPDTITSVGAGVASPTDIWVHTLYDSTAVELLAFNDSAATTYVYVDGVLIDTITPTMLSAVGVGGGSSARRLYTFPDAKVRLLTVRSNGVLFGWVRPIAKALYRPGVANLPNLTRVQVTGDSYTEGDYVRWVKQHMRWDNVLKCGSGSTGYKADGTRLALEDRYVTDIIAQAPDVEIIAMGLNDLRATLSDRTAAVASATTIWDAITAALPATELIIIGPFSNRGIGTNSVDYRDQNLVALDLALQAAALTRGLRFISPIQENWIQGNGSLSGGAGPGPTGHGNSDTYISNDGTHPSADGHEYIGWRLAGHLAVPYLAG